MDFAGATAEPIGHLGLIAATIQDIGLIDIVNKQLSASEDAKKSIEKIIRSKKHFYNIDYDITKLPRYNSKGRPTKNQEPNSFAYQIKITGISSDLTQIIKKRETLGRFVLATNVLDKEIISNESMLVNYKDQREIERGFRFIKNDTFGLDEIYLKKTRKDWRVDGSDDALFVDIWSHTISFT